jgi:hypothetical protein
MREYDIHIVVFFVNAKINTYKLPGVTGSMFVVAKNLESDLTNGSRRAVHHENCDGLERHQSRCREDNVGEDF